MTARRRWVLVMAIVAIAIGAMLLVNFALPANLAVPAPL